MPGDTRWRNRRLVPGKPSSGVSGPDGQEHPEDGKHVVGDPSSLRHRARQHRRQFHAASGPGVDSGKIANEAQIRSSRCSSLHRVSGSSVVRPARSCAPSGHQARRSGVAGDPEELFGLPRHRRLCVLCARQGGLADAYRHKAQRPERRSRRSGSGDSSRLACFQIRPHFKAVSAHVRPS